jgi:hypothetical protein
MMRLGVISQGSVIGTVHTPLNLSQKYYRPPQSRRMIRQESPQYSQICTQYYLSTPDQLRYIPLMLINGHESLLVNSSVRMTRRSTEPLSSLFRPIIVLST